MQRHIIGIAAALAMTWPSVARAQVVRESGTQSLARILDGYYDEFTLMNARPAILFVDLDSSIYQVEGRPAEDHAQAAAEEPGGCEDEGGPGGFCLQVLDAGGNLLCWADRPVRPGWQRDPRLACPLLSSRPDTYTLRVSARGEGENPCAQTASYPWTEDLDIGRRIYLLTASVRTIVAEGSLIRALAQSVNAINLPGR